MRGLKGEKGDRGLQGLKGDQGIQGLKGDKGEKGDRGDSGPRGIQGLQGTNGLDGSKGDKGDKGDAGVIRIRGTVSNESQLPLNGQLGDAYWLEEGQNYRLYIWTDDPNLVTVAGWYRGVNLKGTQGVQGTRGERGEKGDKGDTPVIQDATTTSKGVVQVGSGLLVNNGVISLDKNNVINNVASLNGTVSDYPEGLTVFRVPVDQNNALYVDLVNLMNSLTVTELTPASGYARFVINVLKSSGTITQDIECYASSNVTSVKGYTLTRTSTGAGNEFTQWRVTIETLLTKGVPSVSALPGMLAYDSTNNITYVKKGTLSTLNNGGWEIVSSPPKGYLMAQRDASEQVISAANTVLLFNKRVLGNIPYNETTAEFTLTAGKVYRITVTAEWLFSANAGFIELALANSSNALVTAYQYTRYIAITANSNESTQGPFEIIFSPTTTGGYKIKAYSVQAFTARLKHNYSRLLVQEI